MDGVSGKEGGSTICAFWMVEAKARSDQLDDVHLVFEKLIAQANPLGLLAQE